jgi:DNA-binding HxlR family transcriptional regulator
MKLEKVTSSSKDGEKRWYDDACGTALAMELVGERWSLLIVRELMFGPRRFGELRGGLHGISANVLTQRLDGLETARILTRRKLPPPANVQVYELTPWGYESATAIRELGRWAVRSPQHDPTLPLSPASMMMSMQTLIIPDHAREHPTVAGFRFGPEMFVARVNGDGVSVTREDPGDADVDFTVTTDPQTLVAHLYGGVPLTDLETAGVLTVAGDRTRLATYRTLFRLPEKVA